jgi:glycerophosphoryl diester phosphodiesterase
VELDVRRSADGSLVVRHDAELAEGRPSLGLGALDLPPEVPLLGAALDALAGARLVNTEIKNWPDDPDFDPDEQLARAVVDLLRERGELGAPRHLVSAFHLPTVDRVRELAPEVRTGWLRVDVPEGTIERAARHGHVALHPHHAFVTEALVAEAHAAGLEVNAWTVDDPDRLCWLRDIGVDTAIANDPAAALAALAAG